LLVLAECLVPHVMLAGLDALVRAGVVRQVAGPGQGWGGW
jgi:hypothetical protein